MPKVSQEHRTAQRHRIQQAAMAVVRRKGLGATTMGDIIKESGLSAGAIYGYYAGKDELVLDVGGAILGERREMLGEMARRPTPPPPAEMLRELLATIPADLIEGGLLLQFWSEVGTGGAVRGQARENLTSIMADIEACLAAWSRYRGADEDEATALAQRLTPVVSAMAQGYILQAGVLADAMDRDAYLTAASEVLAGALAG